MALSLLTLNKINDISLDLDLPLTPSLNFAIEISNGKGTEFNAGRSFDMDFGTNIGTFTSLSSGVINANGLSFNLWAGTGRINNFNVGYINGRMIAYRAPNSSLYPYLWRFATALIPAAGNEANFGPVSTTEYTASFHTTIGPTVEAETYGEVDGAYEVGSGLSEIGGYGAKLNTTPPDMYFFSIGPDSVAAPVFAFTLEIDERAGDIIGMQVFNANRYNFMYSLGGDLRLRTWGTGAPSAWLLAFDDSNLNDAIAIDDFLVLSASRYGFILRIGSGPATRYISIPLHRSGYDEIIPNIASPELNTISENGDLHILRLEDSPALIVLGIDTDNDLTYTIIGAAPIIEELEYIAQPQPIALPCAMPCYPLIKEIK